MLPRRAVLAVLPALLSACATPPDRAAAPSAPPVASPSLPPPPVPAPPPASASASALAPAPVAPPSAPASDLLLDDAPAGQWSGAQGNTPMAVTGIRGASGHVFAVGSGVVLHSADRGLHWTAAAGPTGWVAVWGSSIDDVYVGGSNVVRSTDRGATWVPVASPAGSVATLWGAGPDVVYAAGGEPAPFVARTSDHGKTWATTALRNMASWIYTVAGTGPNNVWLGGKATVRDTTPGAASDATHSAAVLLRSTDGGKTWKGSLVAPSKMTSNEEVRNVCFTASGALFASYSYGVFSTRDQGSTWALAVEGGGEILGLGCSGREILVGARNRHFRHSVDEGASWTSGDLDALWKEAQLFTLQAAFVTDTGDAYVGGDAYNGRGRGTLVRRAR